MRSTRTLLNLTLVLCALIAFAPFAWMILSSLKPQSEIFAWPPRLLPTHLTGEHYRYALEATGFPRYFLNSLIVTSMVVAGNLLVAVPAGYAFARLPLPGRDTLFMFVLGTMMIPGGITVIPLFLIAKNFPLVGGNDILGSGGIGLLNTYPGLALPHLVLAFAIFLSRQYFQGLPGELADAARIDGASEGAIFWRVYLPLALPLTGTVGIFSFVNGWDDFLWPLIVTTGDEMRTVQIGLSAFQSQGSTNWGPLLAAAVLVTIPIVVVFLANQRHFISGLTTGSSK